MSATTLPAMPDARAILIANERIKVTATAFNNLSVASLMAGVIGPVATLVYDAVKLPVGGVSTVSLFWTSMVAIIWIAAGIGLHLIARATLGRLRS